MLWVFHLWFNGLLPGIDHMLNIGFGKKCLAANLCINNRTLFHKDVERRPRYFENFHGFFDSE